MRGERYRLMAEGLDKAGIVFKVCRLLTNYKANIIDMKTRSHPSAGTGTPIYTMDIEMVVPKDAPLEELSTELNRVGDDLAIEIQLKKSEE